MSELPGRSVRVTRKFRRSDDAAYHSRRADTPVETFTLLTGSERKKKRDCSRFHATDLALLVQTDAAILSGCHTVSGWAAILFNLINPILLYSIYS